ncbi:hypothetical protein MJD09_27380 [bacterium]|nr:hypothetical protein [bacterium]
MILLYGTEVLDEAKTIVKHSDARSAADGLGTKTENQEETRVHSVPHCQIHAIFLFEHERLCYVNSLETLVLIIVGYLAVLASI